MSSHLSRFAPLLTAVVVAVAAVGLVTATDATAAGPATLTAGQRLVSGATVTSPAGKYRLVMQTDGNLVERRVAGNVAIWTSRTAGRPGAGLIVQTDGNVVVYPRTGRAVWSTRTSGSGVTLSIQDDGNLVVRASSGRALWTSGADRPTAPPPAGDVLRAGQTWTSSHPSYYSGSREFQAFLSGGMFSLQQETPQTGTGVWSAGLLVGDVLTPTTLTLQRDGNLVLLAAGRVNWSSGTAGSGTANTLTIQDDGNIVIRNSAGRAVWASGSARAILAPGKVLPVGGRLRNQNGVDLPWADLTMQPDGNLVLRYGTELVWSSGTHVAGSRLTIRPTATRSSSRRAVRRCGRRVPRGTRARCCWSAASGTSRSPAAARGGADREPAGGRSPRGRCGLRRRGGRGCARGGSDRPRPRGRRRVAPAGG